MAPRPLVCFATSALLLLTGCSGEDDGSGGKGSGIGAGANGGAAGNGNLGLGGRAGQGGKSGGAGQAGNAGEAGRAGEAGKAGQAGEAGEGGSPPTVGGSGGQAPAGQAGAAGEGGTVGGGQSGAGGGGQGGAPGKCGNEAIDPGERCDGSLLGGATCKGLLNDEKATGQVTCLDCRPDTSACSSCLDGRKSPGGAGALPEGDIDCGGGCDVKCTLGMTCNADADCDPAYQCFGGVCHATSLGLTPTDAYPTATAAARVPIILASTLSLPKTSKVTLVGGTDIALLPANATVGDDLRLEVSGTAPQTQAVQLAIDGVPLKEGFTLSANAAPGGGDPSTLAYAAFLGPCSGALGPEIKHAQPRLEIPAHTSVCLVFINSPGPIEGVQIGAFSGSAIPLGGTTYAATVFYDAPLADRVPASLLVDLIADVGGKRTILADAIRVVARTYSETGAGNRVGTPLEPATLAQLTGELDTLQAGATVQLTGAITLPPSGLTVPSGITLQGLDPLDPPVLTSGVGASTSALISLGDGAKLREVELQGKSGAQHCVFAKGADQAAQVRDVKMSGCNAGVDARGLVVVSGERCAFVGSQTAVLASETPDVTVVGCSVDTELGSGFAVVGAGATAGTQTLKVVRPTIAVRDAALVATSGGVLDAIAPTVLATSDVGGPALGGRLTVLGGKVTANAGQKATRGFVVAELGPTPSELRLASVSLQNLGGGAIVGATGTCDLLNVEIVGCGTSGKPGAPAIEMKGATGRFDEVFVSGSLGNGLALSGGDLAAFGLSIDASGEGGVVVSGGKLVGRGLFVHDATLPLLDVADGAVLELHDSALTAMNKRTQGAPLIASRRLAAADPADDLNNVTLQAGAGKALTTKSPAAALCGTLLEDPVGGFYITTASDQGKFCF